MISDQIKKEKDRNIYGGHFGVVFEDDSHVTEKECSWRELSEDATVKCNGGTKTVKLSKFPVKLLNVTHEGCDVGLIQGIHFEKGDRVYYSIRSASTFTHNGTRRDEILGKVFGVVRDGEVVEERYIDNNGNLTGFRK
jgi:hypothetical protein